MYPGVHHMAVPSCAFFPAGSSLGGVLVSPGCLGGPRVPSLGGDLPADLEFLMILRGGW